MKKKKILTTNFVFLTKRNFQNLFKKILKLLLN